MPAASPDSSPARRVVGVAYWLYDDAARALPLDSASFSRPLVYLEGTGAVPRGLERALVACVPGQQLTLRLTPDEGFGAHDPARVFAVPRAHFGRGARLEVGMPFAMLNDQGAPTQEVAYVVEVGAAHVRLDTNHPLAGRELHVDAHVVFVRPPSDEELRLGAAIPSEAHNLERM